MKSTDLILAMRKLLHCVDMEIITDKVPTVKAGDIIRLRKYDGSISGAFVKWIDDPDISMFEAAESIDGENDIDVSDDGEDEEFDTLDDTDDNIEKTEDGDQTTSYSISESYMGFRFSTNSYAMRWARIQNKPYLAVVTDVDKNNNRVVIVTARLNALRKAEPLKIALTDNAVQRDTVSKVATDYQDRFLLPLGDNSLYIVNRHIFSNSDSFQITDGSYVISVIQDYRSECGGAVDQHGTDKIWAIKSGYRPFHRSDDYRIELWLGEVSFTDATSATALRDSDMALLASGNEKYIGLWKRYAELELSTISEKQKKAGTLIFRQLIENTAERAVLLIEDQIQLKTFLAVLEEIDKENMAVEVYQDENRRRKHASVRKASGKELTIEYDDGRALNFSAGYVSISIQSAAVQYQRRKEAYDTVLGQLSAKPGLLSLLNGKIEHLADEKRRLTPLSNTVLKKIFPDHPPTPNQIEAIKIALNTPDLAIIQGPPGTGKTTVIRAIYEALSEKEKEPRLFFGRNLATAYQRDATVHLASEMDVYGLPAQTFLGRRNGGWEEGSRAVSQWLEKTKQKVFEANPLLEGYAAIDRLSNDLNLLQLGFNVSCATAENRRATLRSFLFELEQFETDRASQKQPEDLDELHIQETYDAVSLTPYKERARKMLDHLDKIYSHEHAIDICYAVMLPTTPEAMNDNGAQVIKDTMDRLLNDRQTDSIRSIATGLSKLYAQEPIRYERVKDGVNALISELRQNNRMIVNRSANEELMNLIQETIEMLHSTIGDDEMYLLSYYVNAFEDTETMRESLSRFLTVIAATNQMVGSKDVIGRKKPNSKETETPKEKENFKKEDNQKEQLNDFDTYENIVIDEAARSCPPDLLIPMCRAKERIILVGDHKQLPQFISDDVYKSMKAEGEDSALLKKSMFEYLIEQTEKLEQTGDGAKRYIMLDQQFRMPAIVGDLVSRHFYKDHPIQSPLGNGGAKAPIGLSFGISEERIQHSHMIWLDVPGTAGTRESKDNTSRYRMEEVVRITNMLKTLIVRAEGQAKDYKYGIITFYKAQERRLKEHIRSVLLSDERAVCSEEWFNNHVEIGTVDAFQGKEFDIVFLSMVRCHTDYGSFHYGDNSNGKAKYGFTMDENRLCVALSRVKRCLIIAGDENMFNDDTALREMPAIYDFLSICKNEDGGSESYAWFIKDNSNSSKKK